MAKREVVALNTSVPQLQAAQSGDTYQLVRDVFLTTGVITSEVADGASAVGFVFDTENAFSTSGAKLASWKNGGTEKAYVDKDGNLAVEKISVASTANPFVWTEIRYEGNGWVMKSYAQDVLHVSGQRSQVITQAGMIFGWAPSTTISDINADTALSRSAAATVRITDGSTGTGKLEFFFPTSDPGIAGMWWDNGTILVRSAG